MEKVRLTLTAEISDTAFERIAHVELDLVGLSLQDLEDEEGSLRDLFLKMLDKKLSEAITNAKKKTDHANDHPQASA